MTIAESAGDVPSVGSARTRLLLLNSTVAFAIAYPVMVTIHEFAHAVAGSAMGLHPVVYPGQVVDGVPGTAGQQVLVLLAGPIGSLVTGLVILLAAPAVRGFWGLFLLWFGALSVQEFTGYLMTGPFLAIGDIGSALRLLAAPLWAYWLLLLGGALGTVLLGRHFTGRLQALVDPAAGGRATQLRSLGLFAWLLGAAVTIASGLVASLATGGGHALLSPVGLVETVATLTSGVFVFAVRFFMGRDVPSRGMAAGWAWPAAGVVVLVLVDLVRTLVLGPGLQL